MSRRNRRVEWQESADARIPWEASVDGKRWQVRLSEFPEEEFLYSLLVDGNIVEKFHDWPECWTRPAENEVTRVRPLAKPEEDPYQKREYELETEKFERTRNVRPSKLVQGPPPKKAETT